jgi:LPS export ABC transporter protein LptC
VSRVRSWRGILLLALLAALTWQLSRRPTEISTVFERPDIRLNYALYDFNGIMLDEQGRVKLEIASPVLRNNADSGIGTVDSPVIDIQQEQERWYITAESAIISADRESVTLTGDVHLSRQNEVTGRVLDITTSDVVLNVTPRTAMTETNVSILQQGDRLDAVGMKLDMINQRYELLNEVRAHYQTN